MPTAIIVVSKERESSLSTVHAYLDRNQVNWHCALMVVITAIIGWFACLPKADNRAALLLSA